MKKRLQNHIIFWICWILGFTFIKSFGKSYEYYFGWFSYYVVTLPIFVSHTYLIAYVLIPRFFSKKFWPLFTLLFLGLFYGFSVLELIFSNEFIYQWYPTGFEITEDYLTPGNIVISGLGNLYIVLVFIAARTVRNWFKADSKQKELIEMNLKQQMEDTITKVQPLMLLYAIDHIDSMVERSSPDVTRAIALTSELLSEVMIYHGEGQRWFSREIELVKKLGELVSIWRESKPELEFFITGDPGKIDLPPMILFSFVDLVFRRFDKATEIPELNIEASGYSNMVTIQMLNSGSPEFDEYYEECIQSVAQLKSSYAGKVFISYVKHSYGCSVVIRSSSIQGINATHSLGDGVDITEPVGV